MASAVFRRGKLVLVHKAVLRKSGKGWEPKDAASAYEQIEATFHDVLELTMEDHVFLEEPVMGRSVRPTIVQAYVSGIIQAIATGIGAEVTFVNNKAWKKEIVGNGNASKDETRKVLTARDRRLARLCGTDGDLYDAVGIALYGTVATAHQ